MTFTIDIGSFIAGALAMLGVLSYLFWYFVGSGVIKKERK